MVVTGWSVEAVGMIGWRAALVGVLVAFAGAVLGWQARTDEVEAGLCLSVLDVGQGDSLLVSFPSGAHWLVDGGGLPGGGYDIGAGRVLPALRRRGIERLDRVLVTHAHGDHFEGLFSVLDQVSVGELWLSSRRRLPPRMGALLREAESRGVPIRVAELGDPFLPPDAPVRATLLHPTPGWNESLTKRERSENDRSLVVRLGLGEVSFLLTGDIEAAAEAHLVGGSAVLRSTVLKVPHHGSRTSSTPSFVQAVDPALAVAGIGRGNRFGFPHASVTTRYLRRGVPLYWTGRHGAVRACTDGFDLRVDRELRPGRWSGLRRWGPDAIRSWVDRSLVRREEELDGGGAPAETGGRAAAGAAWSAMPRDQESTERRPGSASATKPGPLRGLSTTGPQLPAAGAGDPPSDHRASPDQDPLPVVAPEPEIPVDLRPSRGWSRERKRRARLRAPWKGGS